MLVSGKVNLLTNNIKNTSQWARGRSPDVLGKMETLSAQVAITLSKIGDIALPYISGCSVEDLVNKFSQDEVHDALIRLVYELSEDCEALKTHVDKVALHHTIMIR